MTAYQRTAGRSGPGAGRPAKLYRLSTRELSVSVPPRAYELLGRLLAETSESDTTGKVRATMDEVAHNLGRQLSAEPDGDPAAVLEGHGYQPHANAEGVLELRNGPFHRLAQEHEDLVCSLNLCLVRGVIAASRRPPGARCTQPAPGPLLCRCARCLSQADEAARADRSPASHAGLAVPALT